MRALFLLLVCLAGSSGVVQDAARIGSFKFTAPPGWTATSTTTRVIAFAPPGLAARKICQVRVFADEPATEAFSAWFTRRWNALMGGKPKLRVSDVLSQKLGPIEALVRSEAYSENGGESYELMIGASVQGRFLLISYEANDYALIEKHQEEVFAMLNTFDLVSGAPGTTGTAPTTGPVGPPVTNPGDSPVIRSRPGLTIPTTLPTGLPMPAGSPDQAASILAQKVASYGPDSLPALVTAIRACGFAIRTSDRKLIAGPLTEKGNGIFVDDEELLTFFAMSCRGDSMEASGIIGGVDNFLAKGPTSIRLAEVLPASLSAGLTSSEPSTRFYSRFLVELGRSLPQKYDLSQSQIGKPTRITPLETFLILRVFTENLRRDTRNSLKRFGEEPTPGHGPMELASGQGQGSQYDMTGSQEDLHAFIETWSVGVVLDTLGKEHLITFLNSVNLLSSFLKFLSTYYCLETSFTVSPPGEPLIRTHAMSTNGDRRTLNAEVKMNSTKIHAFLKHWRNHLGLIGVDFDMPSPGNLVKTNVRWRLLGYTGMNTLQKPVQFVGSNIEETETDTDGVAHVDIEGVKQRQTIPASSPPVKIQVPISVMVQVKGPEMGQDMADAFTGAVGLGAENPLWGVPGVIQEMIFRSKILVNGAMSLQVIDWTPGFLNVAFFVHVSGNGRTKEGLVWSVNRSYEAVGRLIPSNNSYIPAVAAEIRGRSGTANVFGFQKEEDSWLVTDKEDQKGSGRGCDNKMHTWTSMESFNGPLTGVGRFRSTALFEYIYDYATKTMYLHIRPAEIDYNHRRHVTRDEKVIENKNEDEAGGFFPDRMSSVSGYYILHGARGPDEITSDSPMALDYKDTAKFHDGTLNVLYKFVIKPFGEGDRIGPPQLAVKDVELPDFLKQFIASPNEPPADTDNEAATCYATASGPLRSLHPAVGRK